MVNSLNDAYKSGMIWFILGSLISSDNFSYLPYPDMKEKYNSNISILKEIIQSINETEISDDDKIKINKYCKEGIEILEKELEGIKNGNN